MMEKNMIEEARKKKFDKDRGTKKIKTFANPKSASFTDPLASTKIFAHLISLQNMKERDE